MVGVFFTDKVLNLKHQISNTKNQTSTKFQTPKTKQKNFNILNFRHLDLFGIWNLEFGIFLLVICYLLFTSIFIATNKWAALYKLAKITEFIFLGLIIYKLKPNILTVLKVLAHDTIYVSLITITQFILQRSIGGGLWWLGERTFYAGTPGIAAIAFHGQLLLRPYAVFPHPNVLGGFLTIVLPFFLFILLYRRKFIHKLFIILFLASFILGMISLFLSFSRAAWVVTIIGFLFMILEKKDKLIYWLKKHKAFSLLIFYTFIFLSMAIPLILPVSGQSFMERVELIKTAINMVSRYPFFGRGLNNFIVHLLPSYSGAVSLIIAQPVHNVYLLIFTETGLVGFSFLLMFLAAVYYKGLSSNPLIIFAFIQLFFLGFFDHYLFTLQQGQLLFTVCTVLVVNKGKGLVFPPRNK